jgi:hypothetical protein
MERKLLTYDGSHLGEFEFLSVVPWCYPCTKGTSGLKTVTLFAVINLPGILEPQNVILKRNCAGHTDQLVIDELKPIFDLQKMGSHGIRLHGIPRKYDNNYPWIVDGPNGLIFNTYIHLQWSEYFVFRATTKIEDTLRFIQLPRLDETQWLPTASCDIKPGHKKFFFEIQKILIFRELMRVGSTNLGDILIKNLIPLSIDEMVMKNLSETPKKITQEIENFFFISPTSKTEIIIKMLGLTKETYQEQVEIIRNTMTKIINRVDQDKLWLIDYVINQLIDRCTIYYNLTA